MEHTAPNNQLREVYAAALDLRGREVANEVCVQHGATEGMHPWRRVPSNSAAACVKALEALAGSKPKPRPAATRGFEQVRRKTFARIIGTEERKPAKPAASSDLCGDLRSSIILRSAKTSGAARLASPFSPTTRKQTTMTKSRITVVAGELDDDHARRT